jgi:protease-4
MLYEYMGETMIVGHYRCLVVLSILLVSGCVNVSVIKPVTPLKQQVVEGQGHPKILLLNISGFISEREKSDRLKLQKEPSLVAEIRETLQKAEQDGDISGLIIKINSPGGTVSASDIIHHELTNFKNRKQVPVYACITGLGTSGAYYIAAAADKVYSHPNAITGSIGVIALKFNIEGLMTKLGIQDETIKSGDKKDIFSPFRPLTYEERTILQEVIDDLHTQFVGVVFEQRKESLPMQDLMDLADGRIYTASFALKLHLIDHIGYMDDVIADMKKSLDLEDARIVSYGRGEEYPGTIYSSSPAHGSSLMDLLGDYTDGHSPLPGVSFLYLWNP